MALVIAHISDLHVSRFGEHVTSLKSRRTHGRAAPRGQTWDLVEAVDGWRIERRERELRLVDDAGAVHVRRRVEPADAPSMQRAFVARVNERMRTAQQRLAAERPDRAEVERRLDDDPDEHQPPLLARRPHPRRGRSPIGCSSPAISPTTASATS